MEGVRTVRQRYTGPVVKPVVEADRDRQGLTGVGYLAASGRKRVDDSHRSDARKVVVDRRLAVTVDGERHTPGPGGEVLVPRQASHHVENRLGDTGRWPCRFEPSPEKEAP